MISVINSEHSPYEFLLIRPISGIRQGGKIVKSRQSVTSGHISRFRPKKELATRTVIPSAYSFFFFPNNLIHN